MNQSLQYDDWNFKNGCLFLGPEPSKPLSSNSSVSTEIKQYVVRTSQPLYDRIEQDFIKKFPDQSVYDQNQINFLSPFLKYRNEKISSYMEIVYAQLDYRLKISKTKEYCAVYSETGIHCDIYQQFPSNFHGVPMNEAKHLCTLTRSTYYPGEWIIEFINHPDSQEALMLFHHQHGVLDIYDMTGKIKYPQSSNDNFFKRLEWVNDKYFLLHAWIWQPWDVVYIYNLDQFLTNPNDYAPEYIWSDGDYIKNYPKVINGAVIMGKKVITQLDTMKSFEQDEDKDQA